MCIEENRIIEEYYTGYAVELSLDIFPIILYSLESSCR